MKKGIEQCSLYPGGEKSWWKWDQICDKCGKLIFDKRTSTHSNKPNTDEADFCLECMCEFMDKKIPYKEAAKLYKK